MTLTSKTMPITTLLLVLLLCIVISKGELDIEAKVICSRPNTLCFFYISKPAIEIRCVLAAQGLCQSLVPHSKLADVAINNPDVKKFLSTQLPSPKIILNASPVVKKESESAISKNTSRKDSVHFSNRRWEWLIEKTEVIEKIYTYDVAFSRFCEDTILIYDVEHKTFMEHSCPNKEKEKFSILCVLDCEYEWLKLNSFTIELKDALEKHSLVSSSDCQLSCLNNLKCYYYKFIKNSNFGYNCLLAKKNIVLQYANNSLVHEIGSARENYCVGRKIKKVTVLSINSCTTSWNYWIVVLAVIICWVLSIVILLLLIELKKHSSSVEPDLFSEYLESKFMT